MESFLDQFKPKTTPPAPAVPAATTRTLTPYGRAVLDAKCAEMRLTPKGQRNDTMMRLGRLIGGYIGGGEIPYNEGHDRFRDAALASGLPISEVDYRLAGCRSSQGGGEGHS